eukprot:352904-Chlamydomonas_euryale.AAC.1
MDRDAAWTETCPLHGQRHCMDRDTAWTETRPLHGQRPALPAYLPPVLHPAPSLVMHPTLSSLAPDPLRSCTSPSPVSHQIQNLVRAQDGVAG